MSKASFSLFRGELMALNLPLSLQALSIAEDAHNGVIRKDGVTPYLEHLCKVASILFELGVRSDVMLAAAILHDVIEDTSVDAYTLTKKYSSKYLLDSLKSTGSKKLAVGVSDIVEIVLTLSKVDGNFKKSNEDYYKGLTESAEASLIKLADRTHNLATLASFSENKKAEYLAETVQFIYPLVKYAQHHYYQYGGPLRILDLWIESLVENLKPYVLNKENVNE